MADVKINVQDSGGSGRPVVLIHGWPLSGAAWEKQIPALTAAGYRAISYDRRGFGHSDHPESGYDYDTLTRDLINLIDQLDLDDVTLVGFSMGGGEVARYVATEGEERLHSVVFASAIPPFLMQRPDNPEGPLTAAKAAEMTAGLTASRDTFFDKFTRDFFSAKGVLKVSEADRQKAIALCHQSSQTAALSAMASFGNTDFRGDLTRISVPTLVIHGDSDAIVPFEGSGARTHAAIAGSSLVVLRDGPHGINVSHADEFNSALIDFLER